MNIVTDLQIIAAKEIELENENDHFRIFLKGKDTYKIDKIVHKLNEKISAEIDCTTCGNCCKTLMINVTEDECKIISTDLEVEENIFNKKYIEKSNEGQLIINTIPCHFLADNKCTIYKNRFEDCRDFPHLHKKDFIHRLFGTLMHYGRCPIVYNVIEELKIETKFIK